MLSVLKYENLIENQIISFSKHKFESTFLNSFWIGLRDGCSCVVKGFSNSIILCDNLPL